MRTSFKCTSADYVTVSKPELRLLAAVLAFAVGDLINGSFNEVKSALTWFKGEDVGEEGECFTFAFVMEHLELSAERTEKLYHMIRQAGKRRQRILDEIVNGHADRSTKSVAVDFTDLGCKMASNGKPVKRFRKGRTLAA